MHVLILKLVTPNSSYGQLKLATCTLKTQRILHAQELAVVLNAYNLSSVCRVSIIL